MFFLGFQPRRSLLSRKNVNGENGVSTTEGAENGVVDSTENADGNLFNHKTLFFTIILDKSTENKEHAWGLAGLPRNADKLESNQVHKLRQHELFLSRQVDTLPATQIRGKCAVVMLSEVETCDSYLNREDGFFYSLVFDASNKTLLADKGKIEIGDKYQAQIPDIFSQSEIDRERGLIESDEKDDEHENGTLEIDEPKTEENDEEKSEKKPVIRERRFSQNINGVYETRYESVVYHPNHNLTDRDIDQFLIIAR